MGIINTRIKNDPIGSADKANDIYQVAENVSSAKESIGSDSIDHHQHWHLNVDNPFPLMRLPS